MNPVFQQGNEISYESQANLGIKFQTTKIKGKLLTGQRYSHIEVYNFRD